VWSAECRSAGEVPAFGCPPHLGEVLAGKGVELVVHVLLRFGLW
jgi:hypothetical protein